MSTNRLICPNCSFENQQGSYYCSKCGYPLNRMEDEQQVVRENLPDINVTASSHKVCSGCQAINIATAKYCAHCGLLLPMALQAEAEHTEALAGFWIRFAAYLIDGIVLSAVSYLIDLGLHLPVDTTQGLAIFDDPTFWILQSINLILRGFYYTYCTGKWGQTLGKYTTGIKVVRSDGTPLSYSGSLARFFATALSELTLGIGYLMIAFSPRKRALHDLICGTKVIIRVRK